MLVWWAATSSAMPLDTPPGTLHEADGPAAHELSLQPAGHGAHLDFERRRVTKYCDAAGNYERARCCDEIIGDCSEMTYDKSGNNCHKYFTRRQLTDANGKKIWRFQPCRNPHKKRPDEPCKNTAFWSTLVCSYEWVRTLKEGGFSKQFTDEIREERAKKERLLELHKEKMAAQSSLGSSILSNEADWGSFKGYSKVYD